MKKVDVQTETIIAAPIDGVSEYASNPDNAPEWYVNIKSAEWNSPKPLTVGSQVTFNAQFLGRKLEYVYEITEFVPGEKLVMETADGPFPMTTTYTWHRTENGHTHMTLRNTGQPTGFSKLFAPFISSMMRNANNKDLKKLKQILETKTNKKTKTTDAQ